MAWSVLRVLRLSRNIFDKTYVLQKYLVCYHEDGRASFLPSNLTKEGPLMYTKRGLKALTVIFPFYTGGLSLFVHAPTIINGFVDLCTIPAVDAQ